VSKIPKHEQPLRQVVLVPPVHRGRTCRECEYRDRCHLTDAGRLPCEGLTVTDLVLAEHQGTLNELVWWLQLPSGVTAEMLVAKGL